MDQILHILSIIFWGLIVLSLLVYLHEAGHFIAARILGLRVTEFFIGLPCRARLAFVSKKTGTAYGITPLLLGGYTRICGMDATEPSCAARVLSYIYRAGQISVPKIAKDLNLSLDDVEEAVAMLCDWGSIEEVSQIAKDTKSDSVTVVRTLPRDAQMRTVYDKGHDLSEKGATISGEAHPFNGTQKAFLDYERSHTYQKLGFWGRAFVLINGIFVNIVTGFLIVVFTLSCLGLPVATNSTTIGSVQSGGAAAAAGLVPGDTITAVGDQSVSTWNEMAQEISQRLSDKNPFMLTYTENGEERSVIIDPLAGETKLGISASTEIRRLSFPDAVTTSFGYIGLTGATIAQLFNPAHFQEVIGQSSSVIGISVMASEAASQGATSLLLLAAAVSLSLGFMNLIPIPPLDGGKILIEAISALIKRPVSAKVQTVISYIGILLFVILFFVLLKQDIVRFILGGQ